MSDLDSILGLAGVPLMEKEPAGWNPTPEQEKWLGGANRQDPYILWRMPGKKPPISYFKDPSDQELAKAIGYVENPAPVVDRNPPEPEGATTAPDDNERSNPDRKEPEMTPLDGPAKTQAATDNRNKSDLEPLEPKQTKTDLDNKIADFDKQAGSDTGLSDLARSNSKAKTDPADEVELDKDGNPVFKSGQQYGTYQGVGVENPNFNDEPEADIDPDADGEDMNFNPDMTSVQAPKAEPGELKPADRVLDPEDEAELAKKYDDDLAAMKQAANPQASADNDRGTNQNKMRDTMNKIGGASQAQKDAMAANTWDPSKADGGRIDPDADGEDMNFNPDMTPANADTATQDLDAEIAQSKANISDLDKQIADLQQAMMQDNGLDADMPQPTAQEPASVKDQLTKALEPKVDMDAEMPNSIGNDTDLNKAIQIGPDDLKMIDKQKMGPGTFPSSGEDLYKSLNGNLDWLNRNIK